MKREVFGVIQMYTSVVVPLDVAHKIQMLMAEHGYQLDMVYTEGKRIELKRELGVPEVRVLQGALLDATTLTEDELTAWKENVMDARKIDKNCQVMDPVQFKLVRGE